MGPSNPHQSMVTVFRGGGAGLDPRHAAPAHGVLANGTGPAAGPVGPYGRPMAFLDEPDPAMPWAGRLSNRYMGTLTHMLGLSRGDLQRRL